MTDRSQIALAAASCGEPARSCSTRAQACQRPTSPAQLRCSKAATATLPALSEARRTVGGFSTFTNPNAMRIARAAFLFETGL